MQSSFWHLFLLREKSNRIVLKNIIIRVSNKFTNISILISYPESTGQLPTSP